MGKNYVEETLKCLNSARFKELLETESKGTSVPIIAARMDNSLETIIHSIPAKIKKINVIVPLLNAEAYSIGVISKIDSDKVLRFSSVEGLDFIDKADTLEDLLIQIEGKNTVRIFFANEYDLLIQPFVVYYLYDSIKVKDYI